MYILEVTAATALVVIVGTLTLKAAAVETMEMVAVISLTGI